MRPVRKRRCGLWVAVVTVATAFAAAPLAGADAAARMRPVTVERWARSVCRDVSTWLKARAEVETRVSEVLAALSGDVRAPVARARLTRATGRGAEASDRLVSEVRAAGTPNLNDGEQLANTYLRTLRGYGDAYRQARSELARTKTTDKEQFAIAAQQINATLVPKVATDPVEGLRATPELVAGINGNCADVASYLAAKIDPSCRAVVDTTQQLVDVDNRLGAAPADSTESDSLAGDEVHLFEQLGNQLGACNAGALPGACRAVFDGAQRLSDLNRQFLAAPEGSPQEQSLSDNHTREFDAVRSEVAAVCR